MRIDSVKSLWQHQPHTICEEGRKLTFFLQAFGTMNTCVRTFGELERCQCVCVCVCERERERETLKSG